MFYIKLHIKSLQQHYFTDPYQISQTRQMQHYAAVYQYLLTQQDLKRKVKHDCWTYKFFNVIQFSIIVS